MKKDEVGKVAKSDHLIIQLGDSCLRQNYDNITKGKYMLVSIYGLVCKATCGAMKIVQERD